MNRQSAAKALNLIKQEQGSTTIPSGSTGLCNLGNSEYIKTVFIYCLKDPQTNEIRYIGKTNNLKIRYSNHLVENNKNHRCNWIKSLRNKGLKPILEILDQVPEDSWQPWEIFYIELYKNLGYKLTNGTDGGDGFNNGNSKKRIPIKVYNLKGELIYQFDSIKQASNKLNIKTSHISSCCKGKVNTYKNLVFRYKDDKFELYSIVNKKKRPILHYDLDNNFIQEFESITQAAKVIGCYETNISKVLRGIRTRYKNNKFKYKDIV